MNALLRREDIATAIHLTNNQWSAFTKIIFLNHLFQTIQQTKQQLEQEKQQAQDHISWLLSKKSSNQLYQWIINTNLDIPSHLPIGSPHTPHETQTPSSVTHSSHSAEPKHIHICQHTCSKINCINHRREILIQNYPEDQPEGSFSNPITIEDNDDEEVSVLQWNEETRWELVLRFASYHGYTT
jgi:hypothetical protein